MHPEAAKRLNPQQAKALYQAALAKAWGSGYLSYKFHETQGRIYDAISESDSSQFFLLCSRRLGKTYLLMSMALEVCIRKPGARVLFLAPIAKNAAEIAQDTLAILMKDCPKRLQPDFKTQTKEFHFANGAILRLKGVNNETAQDLRGGAQDLIILDECGQMDNLEEVLLSICLPMILTTKGRILLATTPPETSGHDSAHIFEGLAKKGAIARFTLRDAPHIDREEKRKILIEIGEDPEHVDAILDGTAEPKTTKAKREFFCEFVTDAASAVVPEFDERARKEIVVPWTRPEHFDAYVAMDPGMIDNTGVLFAYWDFLNAKLVIEGELLLHHPGTPEIARDIRAKEEELWGRQQPYRRVSDVEKRLIADLRQIHKLDFHQTRKDDSLAAIHLMRGMIDSRELVIRPECVHLVRQLKDVIWNRKGTDFMRAGDASIDAHYDLVAALKYLCRNIDRHRNPYPGHFFAMGGKFGLPAGSYISPKARGGQKPAAGGLTLRDKTTPTGRRLARSKRRAR